MSKIKISFNAKKALAAKLKENAEKESITVTEYLTKVISNGIFIEESLLNEDKVYVGKDSSELKEVLFKN